MTAWGEVGGGNGDLSQLPRLERSQREGTVAQPDEAVHLKSEGGHQFADFAVFALGQGHGAPYVVRLLAVGKRLLKREREGQITDSIDGLHGEAEGAGLLLLGPLA